MSSGHEIVIDNAPGNSGAKPTELVLAAIAGCTGMDVIEIMAKKRQVVRGYRTEVSGVQREQSPNVYLEIDVLHVIEGDVTTEAVRRSIELSATKYCTVSAQLATGVALIHHRYRIERPAGSALAAEETGEVVVTGPGLELATV
jgi:putative redox protein